MNGNRKLTLKRDVLTEIDSAGLGRVVAAGPPTRQYCGTDWCSDTCYSCLTYVSCHMTDCLTDPAIVEPDITGVCG